MSPATQTGSVSVTDHGAVGDGVSDDTESFRRAVLQAENQNIPLIVPPGRYLISGPIELNNSISIVGSGSRSSVLTSGKHPTARLLVRHSDIDIQDLGFEDMIEPIVLDTGEGRALENIHIERNRFENIQTTSNNRGAIGLSDGAPWQRIYSIRNLVVRECVFRDIQSSAINVRANIAEAKIIDNRFLNIFNPRKEDSSGGTLGGFAIRLGESADDAEMLDEYKEQGKHLIEGNVLNGMWKHTVRGNLKGYLVYGDFNIIRDNVLEHIDGTQFGDDVNAMYIRGAYNRISGNTIRHIRGLDDDGAISFKGGVSRGSQHNIISRNIIQHIKGMSAIEISTSHIQVEGNVVEDAPVRGFLHRTGKDLWLHDNTFTDADVDIRTGRREGEGEAFISGNRFINSELQLSQYRSDLHVIPAPRSAVFIQENLFRNTRPGADVRMIRMGSHVTERFIAIRDNRFQNLVDARGDKAIGRMIDLETAGDVQEVVVSGNHIVQRGTHAVLFQIGAAAGSGHFSDNTFIIYDLRGPILNGAFKRVENNTIVISEEASDQLKLKELFVMEEYDPSAQMKFRGNRVINESRHARIGSIIRWNGTFASGNQPVITDNTVRGAFDTFARFQYELPDISFVENSFGGQQPEVLARNESKSAAWTFSGEGSGTISDPYQISNVRQLQEMLADLSAHYILTRDIVAVETRDWNGGFGFEPIGDQATPFSGVLNGDGHRIIGLYINRPDDRFVGLFGRVSASGKIDQLGLEKAEVSGFHATGSLVGQNEGTVTRSFSRGTLKGHYDSGGLIGINDFGTVKNSYAQCEVTGITDIGGLIGYNSGSVYNSYSAGKVNAKARAFGVVGYQAVWLDDSVIRNTYWDADLHPQLVYWASARTTQELKKRTTFQKAVDPEYSSWDIADTDRYNGQVWKIDDGQNYPVLGWER